MLIQDLKIEFHRYDASKWTIETSNGYFLINDSTKKLIEILVNSTTTIEAKNRFNKDFHENYDEVEFQSFVATVLNDLPILDNQNSDVKTNKSYIKFQIKLFSAKTVSCLSKPFTAVFQPRFFWISYIVLAFFSIYIICQTFRLNLGISLVWMMILYLPTVFLHELGHTAACKRFTRKVGEIGFGIYFIFPVFYSDVSSIWKATKEQRIITNLAGVYMQMGCAFLFWILYKIFDQQMFLQMSFLLATYSFIQLIPFIRSDGYWILSDLTATPNLHQRSKSEISKIFSKDYWANLKFNWQQLLIRLYGSLNFLLFAYFILYQVLFNWQEILEFPLVIIQNLKEMVQFNFSKVHFEAHQLKYIVFYFLAFSYLNRFFQFLKTKIQEKEAKSRLTH